MYNGLKRYAMQKYFKGLFFALLTVLSVGCAQKSAVLEGTASYRERIALPPQAILDITLEDVSLMDVKAPVLAHKSEQIVGQTPFVFSLEYDPALIKQGHRYNLRAKITVEGKLMFITDTFKPVLEGSADKEILLMMKKVN
jgi:putative lipoprotein